MDFLAVPEDERAGLEQPGFARGAGWIQWFAPPDISGNYACGTYTLEDVDRNARCYRSLMTHATAPFDSIVDMAEVTTVSRDRTGLRGLPATHLSRVWTR